MRIRGRGQRQHQSADRLQRAVPPGRPGDMICLVRAAIVRSATGGPAVRRGAAVIAGELIWPHRPTVPGDDEGPAAWLARRLRDPGYRAENRLESHQRLA